MKTQSTKEESYVNVKLKLAALWTSFMFLYVYVDYFALYMPGTLHNIQEGKIFIFEITQLFITIALVLASIPMFMIFLSVILPASLNRITNIIVAIILIPYMLFNLAGEAWVHMIFAAIAEVVILGLIIYHAWNWPQSKTNLI